MIEFILYYLPMIICIGGTVYYLKDEMSWSNAFIALIVSVIPVVNIIFAALLLEDIS